MKIKIAKFIATGCYTGLFPIAPGTVASLVLLLLFMLLSFISGPKSQVFLTSLTLIITLVGWWAASVAEQHYQKKDPSVVVIDEWAGMGISVMLIPFDGSLKSFFLYALGFGLFRFFDIIKPFPINRLERLKGGLGIMMDDVLAGVISLVLLLLIKDCFV